MPRTKKTAQPKPKITRRPRTEILAALITENTRLIDVYTERIAGLKKGRDEAARELDGIKKRDRQVAAEKVAAAEAELAKWRAVLEGVDAGTPQSDTTEVPAG